MMIKLLYVLCYGKKIFMWLVIDVVCSGEVEVCVFCGNIGVFMVMLMLCLCKVDGVNCFVIVCLWLLWNFGGFNVMLDVGVDICVD